MKKDILLLEDDTLLGESLVSLFESLGYEIDWAKDGELGLDLSYENRYNIYLFDVNVPNISGFELLKLLRQNGDITKAIFLTSKVQTNDVLQGFEIGADDYIKKPFDTQELIARVKSKMPKEENEIFSQKLSYLPNQKIFICNGEKISLVSKEIEVALMLIQNQNRIVSKDDINAQIFHETPITDTTIRVYIQKVKTALNECIVIENIRGVGYKTQLL